MIWTLIWAIMSSLLYLLSYNLILAIIIINYTLVYMFTKKIINNRIENTIILFFYCLIVITIAPTIANSKIIDVIINQIG